MKKSLNKSNIGIFLLAFKRLKILKKTLKALNHYLHKNDVIYIFFDSCPKHAGVKIVNEVENVKFFLKSLDHKRYKIIFRKKNYGMTKNWFDAYSFMYKKYNKVICLEDDIIIKKGFLEFMYFYLNKYQNDKKIMNITGFGTKINLPKKYPYNCYLTRRSMSWGQGSWRRVWKLFQKEFLKRSHSKIFNNPKNLNLLMKGGQDLLVTLKLDYLKHYESIQLWWIWNILKNNGLCINPTSSLVNNIGYDGSGIHSKKGEEFPSSLLNKKKKYMLKTDFRQEIDEAFKIKFLIKKRTFYIFKNFSISTINLLFLLKKKLTNII